MTSEQNLINKGKPSIPDYKIRDLQSFEAATKGNRQIAGLYHFMMLDCIIDLAYAVSKDFFQRPHLYTDLCFDTVKVLARLHGQYGSSEFILDKEHRKLIFNSIFGHNEIDWQHNQGDFARHRNNFLETVAITVERPEFIDAGFVSLANRILRTQRDYKQYLTGFFGGSIRWSRENALAELTENIAYKIIRDPGISSIFGVIGQPVEQYLYDFDPQSNGDKVVENISTQLGVYDHAGMPITRQRISNLIRAAQTGAEALATIIDFSEGGSEADMQLLRDKSYNWLGALINLTDYAPYTKKYPQPEKPAVAESPSNGQQQNRMNGQSDGMNKSEVAQMQNASSTNQNLTRFGRRMI